MGYAQETRTNFSVKIKLSDGGIINDNVFATTVFEAVERALTKHRDKQSDRAQYSAKKPSLSLM